MTSGPRLDRWTDEDEDDIADAADKSADDEKKA